MADALSETALEAYAHHLKSEEKAPATIEKYLRDIRAFTRWRGRRYGDETTITNEMVAQWKSELVAEEFAPSTINSKLAALNSFFAFIGRGDLHARFLKVQRRVFRDPARDITRKDYERLLKEARRRKRWMLSLVMETICATGMRVSEVRYLTVEALAASRVDVALKGKIRTIFFPKKLKAKLTSYAKIHGITSGPIFLNGDGRELSRHSIWSQMKALARKARVNATKVFPHNLRHLFAQTFYEATNDIVKLADVLGHSSIETTRIYLMTSGREYGRLLEGLGLVV